MKRSLFTQHVHPDEPVHYNLISHISKSQQKTGFLLPGRAVWCNRRRPVKTCRQPYTQLRSSLLYHLFRRGLSSECVYGAHFMPGIYLSELSYEVDPIPILGSYPTWSLLTAAICTKMRLEGSPMLRHPLPLIWASCLLHRPTVPPHKCSTGAWSNAALPLTSHLLLEKQPHHSEPQSSHS